MKKIYILIVCLSIANLYSEAQNASVFYNHLPNTGSEIARISYINPGSGLEEMGLPAQGFRLRKNNQVCFSLRHSNTLLYEYKITSETIKVESQDDVNTFLKGLEPLVALLGTSMGDGLSYNIDLINALLTRQLELEKLLISSDSQSDLTALLDKMNDKINEYDNEDAAANTLFAALDKDDQASWLSLRAYQTILSEKVKDIAKEVSRAKGNLLSPLTLCKSMGDEALKVSLVVQKKIKSSTDGSSSRPVDTVSEITVYPKSSITVRLVPTLLIAPNFGVTNYVLENSKIVKEDFGVTYFLPVTLQYRISQTGWWGSLGLNVNKIEKLPGLFLGIVRDFGADIGAKFPSLTIGAGITVLETPVRLMNGASVGSALPSGVADIKDVIKRKQTMGFGVTVSIGTFNFKSSK